MVVSMVRTHSCGRFWWSECIKRLYAALTRYTWRVCSSPLRTWQSSTPQLLLPVPMKCLGACPAVPIHQHHTNHLPHQPITHQRFARLRIGAVLPKQHNPDGMLHVRNAHLFTEVPVPSVAYAHRFLGLPGHLTRQRLEGLLSSLIHHLPVELQVPHIGPLGAFNVVEDLARVK